jgi:hypothetical protein
MNDIYITKSMTNNALIIFLLTTPLIVGGVIALINSDLSNGLTERIEAWIRIRQEKNSYNNGWLARLVIQPMLSILVKFSDWTDSFSHRGLKNGVRITATLYFVAAWIYFLFIAFVFIAVLVLGGLFIYYILKYLITQGK